MVLSTFQSMMRTAQSSDIQMERVIQTGTGWFSSGPGDQGPLLHLCAAIEARPPKGPVEVRGHSLSQRQRGLCLHHLTFTSIHQRLYTLPKQPAPDLHYPYC